MPGTKAHDLAFEKSSSCMHDVLCFPLIQGKNHCFMESKWKISSFNALTSHRARDMAMFMQYAFAIMTPFKNGGRASFQQKGNE
jgi:hypothetical protein